MAGLILSTARGKYSLHVHVHVHITKIKYILNVILKSNMYVYVYTRDLSYLCTLFLDLCSLSGKEFDVFK